MGSLSNPSHNDGRQYVIVLAKVMRQIAELAIQLGRQSLVLSNANLAKFMPLDYIKTNAANPGSYAMGAADVLQYLNVYLVRPLTSEDNLRVHY